MNRLALAAVLALAIAPIAAAQGGVSVPMLFTSAPPTLDGTISPGEWATPGVETMAVGGSSSPVLVTGSFSGPSDLGVQVWSLYVPGRIYLAVLITDDVETAGDTLYLDVGMATFTIRDGEATAGPSGDWVAVKSPGNPRSIELSIDGALVAPTVIPGGEFAYNIRFVDDDGGPDGEMWRNEVGGSSLHACVPQADLLNAATLLDALAPQFADVGNLAKQAKKLRKAAVEAAWSDAYTFASKGTASSALDRVRGVVKKLEKYQAKAGETRAGQMEPVLDMIMRGARMSSARVVMLAMQASAPSPTAAIEKFTTAEVAFAAGELQDALKFYRKAAKKAGKTGL